MPTSGEDRTIGEALGATDDTIADALLGLPAEVAAAQTGPVEGQRSIDWDGTRGTLSTGLLEQPPQSWDALIEHFGLDPAEVQIVEGSVQIRAWDANLGRDPDTGETCVRTMRYYKAALERRTVVDAAELDEIRRALLRRKAVTPPARKTAGGRTRIIPIGDLQMGKSEGGGYRATIARFEHGIEAVAATCRGMDRIVLAGMGDIVEGCDGHYPGQTFTVELDRREQVRLSRRAVLRAIDRLAREAPLDVVCVPGNHGEHRRDGKAFTRTSDNDDLAVFEQIADICHSSEKYPDVRFGFPPEDDPMVATVDCDGVGVAFHHGHRIGKGATPAQRARSWWEGQALGRRPAGDCQVLVTAHYHHHALAEFGQRAWLQTPALDGGSEWFTDTTGQATPPGILAFTVGDFGDRAWGDVTICPAIAEAN